MKNKSNEINDKQSTEVPADELDKITGGSKSTNSEDRFIPRLSIDDVTPPEDMARLPLRPQKARRPHSQN